MRRIIALGALMAVAGCASTPTVIPATPSQPMTATGLERVIGSNAAQLVRLFGEAVQDFRENDARKLQFTGDACVLDTYLYPENGNREPVVTYVDARNAAGEDVDRAACVEALARR
ncbi:hypothetical protein [Parasphingopyxis sp.]|uniref:hypothetical protein n=1 Tax=Parasphingopyxis sp. TaxID=1920299 RepID=UPI0026022B88|nr:hypothetical protein [Parasphingopyxis sp.]